LKSLSISTLTIKKDANSDSQYPVTMTHVTLEDKRTDCIADNVRLEGPVEFPRHDGTSIFRPLVSVFNGQSIEISSIPVKTRLVFRQVKKKDMIAFGALTIKVSAHTAIVPTVSDTRLVATQPLRNMGSFEDLGLAK
jgi:hypothetical protein